MAQSYLNCPLSNASSGCHKAARKHYVAAQVASLKAEAFPRVLVVVSPCKGWDGVGRMDWARDDGG